ncbi:T17H7.9 [Arabidopsis thaliana]|uniref:T17H7.9 n=1 Tax=Arabidopsis thaliana TaxID=3702 RepID=Q9SY23_ARATH|nr:T17H7.9 [Arabidopsis thaliana]
MNNKCPQNKKKKSERNFFSLSI